MSAIQPTAPGEDFASVAGRLAGVAGVVPGWRPEVFWRATPEELASVFRALAGEAEGGVDRGALAALMKEHPDG